METNWSCPGQTAGTPVRDGASQRPRPREAPRRKGDFLFRKCREQMAFHPSLVAPPAGGATTISSWSFMMRCMQSGPQGMPSIGKAKAKIYAEKNVAFAFEGVAGIVEVLKIPDKFQRLGRHIPEGVLFVGAPSTGKTLPARAVAGAAGVSFRSMSGSEFVDMFVGVGASRVRDRFSQAKQNAPCIRGPSGPPVPSCGVVRLLFSRIVPNQAGSRSSRTASAGCPPTTHPTKRPRTGYAGFDLRCTASAGALPTPLTGPLVVHHFPVRVSDT
jgi:hypothetical protein